MKVKTKSRKLNKAWLADHLHDPYVKMARQDGYRARSAYKLREIDDAVSLIRPGQRVLDLGASPGAWSQYLRRRMAGSGTIIALDVLDMEPIDGVQFVQGDFRDDGIRAHLASLLDGQPVDLVLSDMAPNLSGIAGADAARMADLVESAVGFSLQHLRPGGSLVAKVFHGSGYGQLVRLFKDSFEMVKPIKPKASRSKSAETFLIGRNPKQRAACNTPLRGAERGMPCT